MKTNKNYRVVHSCVIAVLGLCVTPAVALGSTQELVIGVEDPGIDELEFIPTHLSNEPTVEELDGSCSSCDIDYIEFSNTEPKNAQLRLSYDDSSGDTIANIWIKALLCDRNYEIIELPSVELHSGETYIFSLATEDDWVWGDVCYAWVGLD